MPGTIAVTPAGGLCHNSTCTRMHVIFLRGCISILVIVNAERLLLYFFIFSVIYQVVFISHSGSEWTLPSFARSKLTCVSST
jgi:hypothetical protein